MNRTIKNSMLGLVVSVASVSSVLAQDPEVFAVDSAVTNDSVMKMRAFKSPAGFTVAGYEAFVVNEGSIDLSQPVATEIGIGEATPVDGRYAVVTTKRLVKVEFTIQEGTPGSIDDGSTLEPGFHCGLVFDERSMSVDVMDAEFADDRQISADSAAKKVAAALVAHFDTTDDGSAIVETSGNKVTIHYVAEASAESFSGITLGGDSRRFKVSARIFSVEPMDETIAVFKLELPRSQTGGPLLPPIKTPNIGSADGVEPGVEDLGGN